MALAGWHRGEVAIQQKLGVDGPMKTAFTWISGEMPEEHRLFHSTRLPFVPVTTLDSEGRPWTSILAGPSGQPGFISSSSYDQLTAHASVWPGDPFLVNSESFGDGEMLVAGIGIEFSTRRRNKFAGRIVGLERKNNTFDIDMEVNQAIGNCPKYINVRDLIPHPNTSPLVTLRQLHLTDDRERLPDELISFVQAADTVFLGTTYKARPDEAMFYPSHLGQNQRGGRPGFIRVRPSDGRTVVLPDYSGNRLMTSLGNIEVTPLASMTFVDFVTGDILYLTGDAKTLVGPKASSLMPRQNVITTIYITGYVFVRDALPVRQRTGTTPQRSPYSPPIRLLAEESTARHSTVFDDEITLKLRSIEIHSKDLATFTWETSQPVKIIPGQTAVLDFKPLLGVQEYAHMASWNPSSVNDDRIRTWTVSSSHPSSEGTSTFSLTMREKPKGLITGALFNIVKKLKQMKPELLDDARPMGLQVGLVGIAGDFILPQERATPPSLDSLAPSPAKKLLWIAGGIGVTPFLSMLRYISADSGDWDVVLVLSTREPTILLPLVLNCFSSTANGSANIPSNLYLQIELFSPTSFDSKTPSPNNIAVNSHVGRVDSSLFTGIADVDQRDVYLCGPEEFESAVLGYLGSVGVSSGVVHREGFEY